MTIVSAARAAGFGDYTMDTELQPVIMHEVV